MQKAVVARPPEALGQHVLQDQVQEGRAAYGAHHALAGLAVPIAETHLAVLAGEDVLFLNHAPIQIAAQIDQGLLAVAHALAVDHPLRRHAGRRFQAGLFERGQHLGAKHLGQGTVVEQVAVAALAAASLGPPAPSLGIQRRRRHGQMDMGVVVESPGVGVQHRHRAGRALQLFVVPAEGAQRCPSAVEQDGVERALMLPGQRLQFCRQGECEQEVVGRHVALELPFQPLLAFVVLAVRATAMAAGMGHQTGLVTGAARRQETRRQGGAALLHGGEGLTLAGQQGLAILPEVVRLEAGDDIGEGDHLTVPHWIEKRLIKASIQALA